MIERNRPIRNTGVMSVFSNRIDHSALFVVVIGFILLIMTWQISEIQALIKSSHAQLHYSQRSHLQEVHIALARLQSNLSDLIATNRHIGTNSGDRLEGCGLGLENIKFLTLADLVQEPTNCVPVGITADKFQMCVHSVEEDMYVSGNLIREGVWERSILERFVRTLDSFPDAAVLDVGAQLGMYGLQAAHKGRKVMFLEARPHSANHILRSLRTNGMGGRLCRDVFVVNNVVAARSGVPYGVAHFVDSNNGYTGWGPAGPPKDFAQARDQQRSIRLDEALPAIAGWGRLVLKMDMEGSECAALAGARRLVASGRIAAIFMEADHFKDADRLTQALPGAPAEGLAGCNLTAELGRLVDAGMQPRHLGGGDLRVADWRKWPGDMVWEAAS